jgi:hypothetical protein
MAVRLQDAFVYMLSGENIPYIIILMSTVVVGGQRAQFVTRQLFDSIRYNRINGWHVIVTGEKTDRVLGSCVPLPPSVAQMWLFFIKYGRPALMSSDKRKAFQAWQAAYKGQRPEVEVAQLRSKADLHMW